MVIETDVSAARESGNPIRNDFSFGSQPLKCTLGESFIIILTKALSFFQIRRKYTILCDKY